MKKRFLTFVVILWLMTAWTLPCVATQNLPITIRVGNQSFQAVLYDTPAGRQFYTALPKTFAMTELNRNEKYVYMNTALPTASEQVGEIHTGDLMLYGSTCLVLFYETFSTPYSYTRLGAVTNPQGLKAALGTGNVTVQFTAATKSGDVDKSGVVDLQDAILLKRYLAGGYGVSVDSAVADVNKDGSVNLKDVAWITRWLVGGYGITLT